MLSQLALVLPEGEHFGVVRLRRPEVGEVLHAHVCWNEELSLASPGGVQRAMGVIGPPVVVHDLGHHATVDPLREVSLSGPAIEDMRFGPDGETRPHGSEQRFTWSLMAADQSPFTRPRNNDPGVLSFPRAFAVTRELRY